MRGMSVDGRVTSWSPDDEMTSNEEVLKTVVKELGLGNALNEKLREFRDEWKREQIHIAVVGPSRVGKSTHINAHLGLPANHDKAARTSATRQCTRLCTPYPHPRNDNIVLWDVPGVNTLDYTRDNYTSAINIDRYDFFLILTESTITSDSRWLANQITDREKKFYFVRTKTDYAVEEFKNDHSDSSTTDALKYVRGRLFDGLKRIGLEDSKVFLVNSKDRRLFDFPELQQQLCAESYDSIKQQALLLSMGSYNSRLIEAKYQLFEKRTNYVGLCSAVGGAVPVPGVSAAVDTCLIIEETLLYFFGFGLDKPSVRSLEQLTNVPTGSIEDKLQSLLRDEYPLLYAVREDLPADLKSFKTAQQLAPTIAKNLAEAISKQLAVIAVSESVETGAKVMVPVLGLALAAAISCSVTKYQLLKILATAREAARFVCSTYRTQ